MSSDLHPRNQRMRDLMRLSGRHRVHPEISGSSRAVVVVKQARAVFGEGRVPARRLVHAFWDGQYRGLSSRKIVQVDIFVAVDVGAESNVLAIRRELAAADFPFVVGEPLDLSGTRFPFSAPLIPTSSSPMFSYPLAALEVSSTVPRPASRRSREIVRVDSAARPHAASAACSFPWPRRR